MKLAFLIYQYFPFGGQQRDFMRILMRCRQAGHQLRVYSLRWEGEVPHGVELIKVPVKAWSRHTLYQRYSQWVAKALLQNPVDAVIGFSKMPGLDFYYAADPCFAERMAQEKSWLKKMLPRYRHFLCYEQAVFAPPSPTQVMLLSPQQRQDFAKWYPGCEHRLYELAPGIDASRLPGTDEELAEERKQFRKNFSLTDDQIVLLQIGSGFRVKGVDRSIRAVASLPEHIKQQVQFFIVGQDKADKYIQLAQSLGVAERCHFTGGRDDVPQFLRGCDLLLHPAHSESAGYTLLEAVINGLPVLTTDTCGYAFHVVRANAGEVCTSPFSQQELNSRLLAMLESDQKAQWHNNGLAYARSVDVMGMPDTALALIENSVHNKERR